MPVLQIVKDAGGTVWHDATQSGGVASSVQVAIYKPGGAEHQATTAGDAPLVNTTTDASAYAGTSTTIPLTATTGINVGESYILTNSSSQHEWVRVVGISSGVNVTIAEPVQFTHPTGATFQGARMSFDVSAGLAADRGRGYRVEWSYTVDSKQYRATSFFDVVRRTWPEVVLRPDEFKDYTQQAGDIYQNEPGIGLDFAPEIARATEDVKTAIAARGIELDLIMDPTAFKSAIARKVIMNWASTGRNIPGAYADSAETFLDIAERLYDRALVESLQTCRTFDADDSGVVSSEERKAKIGSVVLSR